MKNETGREGSERQGGSCYHGNHPGVCGSRHRDTQTPMRLVPGGYSSPGEGPCARHLEWFPSCPYHFTGGIMTKSLLLFRAQLKCLEGIQAWVKIFILRKKKTDRLSVLYMLPLSPEEGSDSCKASFPLLTCCQRIEADSLALGWGDILNTKREYMVWDTFWTLHRWQWLLIPWFPWHPSLPGDVSHICPDYNLSDVRIMSPSSLWPLDLVSCLSHTSLN